MATGLNGQPTLSGWSDPALVTVPVPGTKVRLTVHRGWFQRLAVYVGWRWQRDVEPLVPSECWGFDFRPARAAGGAWSSHSTGYCIDLNSNHAGSQLWGDSKLRATNAQLAAMSQIKKDTGLLWGGPRWAGGDYGPSDYAGGAWVHEPKARFVDPMHWDLPPGISDPEAWCKAVCVRLHIGPNGVPTTAPLPTPSPSPTTPTVSLSGVRRGLWKDVRVVQSALNRVVGSRLTIDGKWGPATQSAFDLFRRREMGLSGSAATGAVGVQSLTALGRAAGFKVAR